MAKDIVPKGTIVMYRAYDGHETLVCAPVDEAYLRKYWFARGSKRKRTSYYRCVFNGVLEVVVRMTATPQNTILDEDGP